MERLKGANLSTNGKGSVAYQARKTSMHYQAGETCQNNKMFNRKQ